jgi:hypothetical protein
VSVSSIAPPFLVVCAAVFTLGYGLPLAFAPLAWARRFGWEVRPDDLTVYLGRCLGCVIRPSPRPRCGSRGSRSRAPTSSSCSPSGSHR